jgi:hypothetical protein
MMEEETSYQRITVQIKGMAVWQKCGFNLMILIASCTLMPAVDAGFRQHTSPYKQKAQL